MVARYPSDFVQLPMYVLVLWNIPSNTVMISLGYLCRRLLDTAVPGIRICSSGCNLLCRLSTGLT